MLVLGIYDGTHDAGAALVADGRLVAACNEERFTRKKGQGGWPAQSVEACLTTAGASPADVDHVAFAGFVNPNPALRVARGAQARFELDDGWFYSEEDTVAARLSAWAQFESPFPRLRSDAPVGRLLAPALRRVLGRDARKAGLGGGVEVYDHHDAHAASAYFTAGYEPALVVVADGVGDGLALTVYRGEGGRLVRIAATPFPHSYGLLYATMTGFLGFRPFRHEGKLVGLAARGDPDAVPLPFPFTGPPEARRFQFGFGAPLRPWLEALRPYRREDVAAWLQRGLERELVGLLDHHTRATGLRSVALAGGVFANVRLNQVLARRVDRLFVHPHMGDGGLASGAALLAWARRGGRDVPAQLPDVFLGPAWDDGAMRAALRDAGARFHAVQDLDEQVAARLAAGQVVARFDGRMEYGPRSLGNRSILAPASDPGVTDRLNLALSRSDFMPFAPLLRAETADDWVDELAPVRDAARFMTVTVQAKASLREACPAAVHVDGSLRPQVVDAATTPGLHRVLAAYERRTGSPALINTSFNLHEEPIVASPADAVRSWRAARLDAMAMGPYLVTP